MIEILPFFLGLRLRGGRPRGGDHGYLEPDAFSDGEMASATLRHAACCIYHIWSERRSCQTL